MGKIKKTDIINYPYYGTQIVQNILHRTWSWCDDINIYATMKQPSSNGYKLPQKILKYNILDGSTKTIDIGIDIITVLGDKNFIYVCTITHLVKINRSDDSVTKLLLNSSSNCNNMCKDNNYIYISNNTEIIKINKTTDEIQKIPIIDSATIKLCCDNDYIYTCGSKYISIIKKIDNSTTSIKIINTNSSPAYNDMWVDNKNFYIMDELMGLLIVIDRFDNSSRIIETKGRLISICGDSDYIYMVDESSTQNIIKVNRHNDTVTKIYAGEYIQRLWMFNEFIFVICYASDEIAIINKNDLSKTSIKGNGPREFALNGNNAYIFNQNSTSITKISYTQSGHSYIVEV